MVDNDKDAVDLSSNLEHHPRSGVTVHTSWSGMLKHWPKTTLCIVSNEFCERFAYYGMRTVLTFYVLNVLKFEEGLSTIFFNCFNVLCYLTPILGSIIADGYIGKFWTIFSVSILYAIGMIILTIASFQSDQSAVHPIMDIVGLIVIAFGTGGIKPCVSAFGADQFEKGQERMLSVYFSMFYFSINAGSMIGGFIAPIFRSMPCNGQDSCYPLAFGVPAGLMIAATAVFMAASYWYDKPPPKENAIGIVFRIVVRAIYNKFSRNNTGSKSHWVEHYMDTHDCSKDEKCLELKAQGRETACHKQEYVNDTKGLTRVLIMILPVPMFWALYDQQSSVWLLQAVEMNCNVLGLLILPDQMQTLNAVLILIFIPIFQVIIYPLVGMCFKITALRKMVAGGFLASLAFLITGFVQLQVNLTLPVLPDPGQAHVSFMNLWNVSTNCSLTITPSTTGDTLKPYLLHADTAMKEFKQQDSTVFHVPAGKYSFGIDYPPQCTANNAVLPKTVTYDFADGGVYYVAIGPLGAISHKVATSKPTEGTGEFSMGLTLMTDEPYAFNMAVCRLSVEHFDPSNPCDPTSPPDFYYWETNYNGNTDDRDEHITIIGQKTPMSATSYVFKSVKPGHWGLYFLLNRPKDYNQASFTKEQTNVSSTGITFEINGQGGVYEFVITGKGLQLGNPLLQHNNELHVYQIVQDNTVNILWQVPQIFVLTAAEILFSVTGYEFMYSQSSPRLKALVQALWLLTTAIGDAIIVVVAATKPFKDQAVEFFAYAGIMFVVIIIFMLIAIFYYDYQDYTTLPEDEEGEEEGWAIEKKKEVAYSNEVEYDDRSLNSFRL